MKKILFLVCFLLSTHTAMAAIAFDNSTSSYTNGSSTLTFSLTVGSLTNGKLLIGVRKTLDEVTSVTVNGSAATLAQKMIQGTQAKASYLYYYDNPSSGTNTIVINASSNDIHGEAVSLSGAASGPPEASSTIGNINVNNITNTLTTITDGAWIVSHFSYGDNASSFTLDNGQTNRGDVPSQGGGSVISTLGPVSPASAQSNKCTAAINTGGFASVSVSIAPASTPVTSTPNRQIRGIGRVR